LSGDFVNDTYISWKNIILNEFKAVFNPITASFISDESYTYKLLNIPNESHNSLKNIQSFVSVQKNENEDMKVTHFGSRSIKEVKCDFKTEDYEKVGLAA